MGGVVGWVAHKILETAQSPNSSFPFLFDFGLGLGTWDLGLSINLLWLNMNIFQITGLPRPAILNFMFEQPLILDELDLLYKGDKTKSIVFYYQVFSIASNHLIRIISITATHDRERQRRDLCSKDVQENTKEHNSNELLHEKQRFCSRLVKCN